MVYKWEQYSSVKHLKKTSTLFDNDVELKTMIKLWQNTGLLKTGCTFTRDESRSTAVRASSGYVMSK